MYIHDTHLEASAYWCRKLTSARTHRPVPHPHSQLRHVRSVPPVPLLGLRRGKAWQSPSKTAFLVSVFTMKLLIVLDSF